MPDGHFDRRWPRQSIRRPGYRHAAGDAKGGIGPDAAACVWAHEAGLGSPSGAGYGVGVPAYVSRRSSLSTGRPSRTRSLCPLETGSCPNAAVPQGIVSRRCTTRLRRERYGAGRLSGYPFVLLEGGSAGEKREVDGELRQGRQRQEEGELRLEVLEELVVGGD
jgi:hypothetical protein